MSTDKNMKREQRERLKQERQQMRQLLKDTWTAEVGLNLKIENTIAIIGKSLLKLYRVYVYIGLSISFIVAIMTIVYQIL